MCKKPSHLPNHYNLCLLHRIVGYLDDVVLDGNYCSRPGEPEYLLMGGRPNPGGQNLKDWCRLPFPTKSSRKRSCLFGQFLDYKQSRIDIQILANVSQSICSWRTGDDAEWKS